MILSDEGSWINEHLIELVEDWEELGHRVQWTHEPSEAQAGDFCLCLSYGRILPESVRAQYRHNLVVHESALPHGRGWSPLTWQVLEGADRIPVTLLEAVDAVDAGDIYLQTEIELAGHELVDELRASQAEATLALCRQFVEQYPQSVDRAQPQQGEPSWYPRRTPKDSALDPEQSLAEQFELLRIVDNERYPAWFEWRGCRYTVAVYKGVDGCKNGS